jgi:rhodanese-related sulfurtransferase
MFTFVNSIDPRAVHAMIGNGESPHLIDVRSRAEYAKGHAVGAVSMPLDEISDGMLEARLGSQAGKTQPVYLICDAGIRAEQAAHRLMNAGLRNLALVSGGTQAWQSSGLPLARNPKALSPERQAQIAVGVLLLLFLGKAMLLHPAFLVLIALIAVGLIGMGLTARGSLAVLLAQMPWNRRATTRVAPSVRPTTQLRET